MMGLFAFDQRPLLLDSILFRADIQKPDNHLLCRNPDGKNEQVTNENLFNTLLPERPV